MSEKIRPIAVLPSDGVGPLRPGVRETSEETQLIDHEVRRVVDDAHAQVTQLSATTASNSRASLTRC